MKKNMIIMILTLVVYIGGFILILINKINGNLTTKESMLILIPLLIGSMYVSIKLIKGGF